MLLDLINLAKLRRAVVYALFLALLFLVQNLLGAYVAPLGVHAMFIPAAVVCVALFEGGVWGAMFGLVAGYFADMGFAENSVLFTLLFSVIGYFTGVLGKYTLRKAFVTALVLSAGALLLAAFCQMFPFLFFKDTRIWPVLKTGLLQVLWSLPFIFVIYYPCRAIAGHEMTE